MENNVNLRDISNEELLSTFKMIDDFVEELKNNVDSIKQEEEETEWRNNYKKKLK